MLTFPSLIYALMYANSMNKTLEAYNESEILDIEKLAGKTDGVNLQKSWRALRNQRLNCKNNFFFRPNYEVINIWWI